MVFDQALYLGQHRKKWPIFGRFEPVVTSCNKVVTLISTLIVILINTLLVFLLMRRVLE